MNNLDLKSKEKYMREEHLARMKPVLSAEEYDMFSVAYNKAVMEGTQYSELLEKAKYPSDILMWSFPWGLDHKMWDNTWGRLTEMEILES